MNTEVLCIVPARVESQRLSGKPLLIKSNLPMFAWVAKAGLTAGFHTMVATADRSILDASRRHGIQCIETLGSFENGTARAMEACRLQNASPRVLINLQADEPGITPEDIRSLAEASLRVPDVCTLIGPECTAEDCQNPHVVKAVVTCNRALYFTRAAVPLARVHIGAYAFNASARERITEGLPHSPLATAENLEQLAWLEAGLSISVCSAASYSPSINTLSDLKCWQDSE